MLCSCFSGATPVSKHQQSPTPVYIFLISRVHFVPTLVIFNHEALGFFSLDIHAHMFRTYRANQPLFQFSCWCFPCKPEPRDLPQAQIISFQNWLLLCRDTVYHNCLRLGLAGAKEFPLFCEAKTGFSLSTLQLWQAKADERPCSGATLRMPRESGPKSKVAVASWRSSKEEALDTKPPHSSSDDHIQLERQQIQQNKTSMHPHLKMEPLGS